VLSVTGVNEFGTLVSSHDYNSQNADFSSGRMPRMVAFRHALTFATNEDISTHLTDTFAELQNYEIMTGSFLNYYAPEGHGGVITCNPYVSGPDFYDLRLPQENWHHGEAMITTNAWTDGTYTPLDEDFGADAYYNDENPKTHESHWDLLANFVGHRGLHMLSVAYRDHEDMTIWAIGKLSSVSKTPRLEYEWDELFGMEPPTAPEINGETNGKVGEEYCITISSIDPNDDEIMYIIDWNDGETTETDCYPSGMEIEECYTYSETGTYTIRVKAKECPDGLESDWATLEVSMPRNIISINKILQRLLERFPNLFPILRLLL
jgi:hypothetical protein